MAFGVNLFLCVAFATLRACGNTTPLFQGVVHIYVGGLYVYGWYRWHEIFAGDNPFRPLLPPHKGYLLLAIALTLVEVLAFLFTKTTLIPAIFGASS